MTLADAMRKHAADYTATASNESARQLGRIADFCRFKLGWNHARLCEEIHRKTGMDAVTLDQALYKADELESLES
jgi:hypothetical protein